MLEFSHGLINSPLLATIQEIENMQTYYTRTTPYTALLDLLANGWEYPDASAKVVADHQITADELRDEYDTACMAEENSRNLEC